MNVFESLIDELKVENLLEDTVLDRGIPLASAAVVKTEADIAADDAPQMYVPVDSEIAMGNGETVEIRKPVTEVEYFKKRAMDEVSSLQMVEHILTGVEREYAKIQPKIFDDFNVKVALNDFLQVSDNVTAADHKEAEFALMLETESWCTALADRDQKILVAHLCRFCENTRPMLSSRALLATAKFYRNLSYLEPVRAKFDFLITRIFSKPAPDQTRSLLFEPAQMLDHVHALYADWASLSLFNSEEDARNAELARVSFVEFEQEALAATRFDELVGSDLYNRIRLFKSSIAELFFDPSVLVSAIKCNVQVGNVYLRLVEKERARFEKEYSAQEQIETDDHAASMATARSLELGDLFRDHGLEDSKEDAFAAPDPVPVERLDNGKKAPTDTFERAPKAGPSRIESISHHFAGVNRWLIITSVSLIMVSVGLWLWSTYFVGDVPVAADVKTYDVANSPVQGSLKGGRVVDETFHGITLPGWNTMPDEKKKEILTELQQEGATGGWKMVNLMDPAGKTVGYASNVRVEIY